MLKFKRFTSIMLAAAMIGTSFAGCSGKQGVNSSTSVPSGGGTPTSVTMVFPTFGDMPSNAQAVYDEINAITQKEVNIKVKFLPISVGSYTQQINLMTSGSEDIDLIFGFGAYLPMFYGNGQIVSMQQYLDKYGKDITESVGKLKMRCGQINGRQYAVPTAAYNAQGFAVKLRQDIAKQDGIDASKIATYDDLERALKIVKEKQPGMTPLISQASNATLVNLTADWDSLSDTLGVLMNKGDNLKVTDLYETAEYKGRVKMFHKWFNEGLILKDITTNTANKDALMDSGKAFASLMGLSSDTTLEDATQGKYPTVTIQLIPQYLTTAQVTMAQWMLAKNSSKPDKAIQLLNLFYKNREIISDLRYGVKGTDYTVAKDANGSYLAVYPGGVNKPSQWYSKFGATMSWEFGNQKLYSQLKGGVPDSIKRMEDFNNRAVNSKALGFSFDVSNVSNEQAALNNVITQYSPQLEDGIADPDTVLPQFIQKLKANGIDTYIAEKQKQLDQWAKQNNVK